jgi:hypothetical protein
MRMLTVIILIFGSTVTGRAQSQPEPVMPPATTREYKPEEWKMPVEKASRQLDLLSMFAQATRFGGMTVKVPGELQKVPMALLGLQDLEKKGIELYLKELTFKDLELSRKEKPEWMETRPVLPALLRFSTLGASIEAKTKLGAFPLGATFRDGILPFDFDLRSDGYDVGVLPERRMEEADLKNVKLHVAGPVATGIANTFFKDDVAKLVMKYGMGQTLKMNEGGLFGGNTASSILKGRNDSASQAAGTLLDALKDKK